MDKPRCPPLIAEINERNRVFWEKRMARFRKRVEERPDDVKRALERFSHEHIRALERLSHEHTKETPIRALPTLEEIVLDYEEVESAHDKARQSRAAKAPRKRRANPLHDFIDERLKRNPEATAKEIWDALLDDASNGTSGDFQIVGHRIEVTDNPEKNVKLDNSFDVLVSRRRRKLPKKSYR